LRKENLDLIQVFIWKLFELNAACERLSGAYRNRGTSGEGSGRGEHGLVVIGLTLATHIGTQPSDCPIPIATTHTTTLLRKSSPKEFTLLLEDCRRNVENHSRYVNDSNIERRVLCAPADHK